MKSVFTIMFMTLFIGITGHATPKTLTYQGRILKADTTPLTYNNVSFEFNIVADNDAACVLYQETVAGVDLSVNPGVFDVSFGATPAFVAGGATDINGVFNNSLALTCQNASAYNPTATSSRKLKVLFHDGTSWQTLNTSMNINTVPFASAANSALNADTATNSLRLGGALASTFMSKPGAACVGGVMGFDGTSLTCTPIATLAVDWTSVINKPATFSPAAHTHVADEITSAAGKYFTYKPNNVACATNELLKYDGTNWVCGTAAASGISALTGDVTASGTGSVAATVALVGGKTAAQVATAVNDINAVAATYVAKAGSTMTGALNMGGQNLTNTAYITMNASATLHLSNNAASPAGLLAADEGKMWYNSTSDKIEYWDGSAVKIVSNGGSADEITSLVTTGIVQRTGPGAFSTITVNAPLTYAANNLGITVGTAAATVAAGDDSRIVGALQKSGGAMTGAIVMNAESEVRFADTDSSNYVGFKSAGVVGANRIWTLPAADGTASQVLTTDGAGILSWSSPGGSGTVTSVATGTGLSGGPITGSGTISLANTAVTAAAYGSATQVGTFTVDAQGRLTAAANTTVTPAWGSITSTPTTLAGYGITDAASSTLADGKILVGNGSNVATAVTMSGDATLSNAGALALATSGVTAGTYSKITVDAKGRATVGANLAAGDVTTALTYTPVNKAGDTMSGALAMGAQDITNTGNISMAANKYLGLSANSTNGTVAGQVWYDTGVIKYWNGSAAVTLGAAGSGLSSLNGETGGTQTFAIPGSSGTAPAWSSATNAHTLNIPMAATAAVTAGLLSKADYDVFNAKLGTGTAFSGDVSGNYNSTSVDKIKGTSVVITTLTTNNSLKYNGTNWVNAMINLTTDITGTLPVANGGTGATTIGSGNLVVGAGTGAVTSLAGASAGNVVYATGASSWASGTPDAAGLVDKSSVQTISGAKAFTTYIQMAAENEVRFADTDSSNYVGFKSPGVVAANKIWVLPAADGTANQVLKTDGAGGLGWATPAGGSDNLGNHTATTNIQLGANWLSGDGGNEGISIDSTGKVGIGQGTPVARFHVTGPAGGTSARFSDEVNSTVSIVHSAAGLTEFRDGSGNPALSFNSGFVGVGTISPGAALGVKGEVRLLGSTSGYTGFQPAAVAGSTVWTLPTADGSNNQVLTTNGSGILSWSTPSSTPADSSYAAKGIVQFNTDATTSGISVASGVATVNMTQTAEVSKVLQLNASSQAVTKGNIINGTASGALTLLADANTTSYSLTYPAAQGGAGTVLSNNGSGVLSWVTAGAGTVTSVSGTAPISVATGTSTPVISITAGTVTGQVLRWNGSAWASGMTSVTDLRSQVTGTTSLASSCASNQTLTYNTVGDNLTCTNIALPNAQVTGLGALALKALASLTADVSGILPVANGGTGTATGSITGTGALTFTAGGTNTDVTLTPNGTGKTVVSSAVLKIVGNSGALVSGTTSCATEGVGALTRDSSGDLYICK